jgi:hypothetical protein
MRLTHVYAAVEALLFREVSLNQMFASLKDGSKLILVWLGLAFLAGVVAWQLYGFIINAGWAMTQWEWFQRFGWNSYTLGLISKMGVLVAGSSWLFYISFLESKVREWEQSHAVKRKFFQMAGILLASAIFLFLLGYIV